MKPRVLWLALALATGGLLGGMACRHTASAPEAETATGLEPATAVVPEGTRISGNITAIHAKTQTITVKLLLKEQTFSVAPSCRIITAASPDAALADLRLGDPVEVVYTADDEVPAAHYIAVNGVTAAEREAEREEERLEKILTPNPAERSAD
jgi:hypothetical protein